MSRYHRVTYSLLIGLAVLSIVFRYPGMEHEIGVDSFVWHGMVTSLNERHFAAWTLNPLSYFGLYPLSQPSGSVFLLSDLAQVTGVPTELSILILDFAVSLIGLFGSFLLGREFSIKPGFALLLAFVTSVTPEFVSSLVWQVPTRIFFTSLIPLLLWSIIRFTRTAPLRTTGVTVVVLVLMMSIHRLAILMFLVALAAVATLIVIVGIRALRIQFPSLFLRPKVLRNTSWIALMCVLATSVILLSVTDVLAEYNNGVVASGNTLDVQLLNLFVSLARSTGLLLPFAFAGLVVVVRRRAKGFSEPFLVLSMLAFLPTLFLRQYTGFYTIPITSVLIVAGLDGVVAKLSSRRTRLVALAGIAVVSLASLQAIVSYDLSQDSPLSYQDYGLGLYSRTSVSETWIFSNGLTGARVSSIAGRPYLPVGGATTAFQSPDLLIFGFLNPSDLVIRPVKIPDLTIESDSPFYLEGVQAEADWATLHASNVDSIPSALVTVYQPRYLVTENAHPFSYYAYGRYYTSQLALSVSTSRYAIFADGTFTVWQL